MENGFVARFQAGFCEAQAAELVFAKRIGATDVKKNVGAEIVQGFFHGWHQEGKIFLVLDAVVDVDIQI